MGVDLNVPLTKLTAAGSDAVFGVAVEPSVGFMKETASGTDWSAFALGVSLPLTMTVPAGAVRVVPFFSPGVGFGQVSSGGDSRSGERAMLAGGIAVAAGALQITAGVRKIFIEHGVTVYGVSLSLGR